MQHSEQKTTRTATADGSNFEQTSKDTLAAESASRHGQRRFPKWWLLVGYVLIGVLAFRDKDTLLDWIHQGGSDHVFLLYLLGTFFALVPVMPFGVIGGVMGATYGVWAGGAFNWSVSLTGSVLMFLAFRYLFAERGRRALERFSTVERFNERLEQNAFLAILFTRMIPIVPAYVVNVYAALVGVPFRTYLFASAIGKLPSNFMFAYVGEQMFTSWRNIGLVIIAYLLFLGLVFLFYRRWTHVKKGSVS
ncbi:TVP38/TMEM64 family protein [Tumebacillus permanentifrigoris]|uniref:TVP38/TMEM64 family membrane protein n=1 Tax=Tumebacillus permanentifrigoris TaxID=378543 RepID=A0A316D9T6_9BACL|nr:TVP38/TMEM64 family protein [Tumebacillus permanentifrigoris]PWK08959.1 putative membrane protein YdjX (TVP38/TMEM64 family) [Tumebacillus permanentifrigoris]